MHLRRATFYLALSALVTIISCSTSEPYYATEELKQFYASPSDSQEQVNHIFYLIGDTGKPKLDGTDPVFSFLDEQLRQHTDKSSVIFLGDNIYESGMPAVENHSKRKVSEKRISVALDALTLLDEPSFFIPGNHDWRHGQDGVIAQQQFIQNHGNSGARLVPGNGCPGPFHSLIGSEWLFIAIDSEWIVKQGARAETDVSACVNRSMDEVMADVEALVNRHSDKSLLLATHHPLYSNGPHGGFFTWKDHLFPLTNLDSRYLLPLPVLGTVYPVYRKIGNSRQDIPNDNYQAYIKGILEATSSARKRVFASGHEHNLALFDKGDHLSIVSGSGSKTSPSKGGNGADFVISENGYVRLISYKNGDMAAEFWIPSKDDRGEGELVFRKYVEDTGVHELGDEQEYPVGSNDDIGETKIVAPGKYYEAGRLKEAIWGSHYRDVWAAPIEAPVIDLNTKRGGLEVISVGGGQQSVSIVVEDSTGQKSMMRSIDKDPSEALPEVLRQTFANTIIQDQISASHPYGAIAVGVLADEAGVYHTGPEIGFLPETAGLDIPGVEDGALVMFEDFVSVPWFQTYYEKPAGNILGTNAVWVKLQENENGRINEEQFLRTRLFDMFLGDWDRHGGQWFWAEIESEERTLYEPIPIDRDNVFFKSDGLIPRMASRQWALRKFQHFDEDIRDIKGMNFNGRHLDRWFLTQSDKELWMKVAKDLQSSLTDEDIDRAIEQWPEPARQLSGEEVAGKLKARRTKITSFAERYYRVLAKEVNVFGSDKSEKFSAERMDDGSVHVRRHSTTNSGKVLYSRVFKPDETQEIRIFGFEGDDEFEISGPDSDKILIRLIPGGGTDVLNDRVAGASGKTNVVVYDTYNGIQVNISEATKIEYSRNRKVHEYNREGFDYDLLAPLVSGGFNPDDGVFLGGGIRYVREGFRKEPYASLHEFTIKHSLSTSAFSINVKNNFAEALGSFDLNTELNILAPNFRANYFGLGNETEKTNDSSSFYRFRMNQVHVNASLQKRISSITSFSIGPEYAYYEPSEYGGRFISSEEAELGSEDFQGHHFASIAGNFQINSVDNEIVPYYGFRFRTDASLNSGLDSSSETFLKLGSEGSLYYTLQKVNSTIGFRIGAETNIGDFNFFRSNTLGGSSMLGDHGRLRGYLRDRFAGRSSFYQNTEVRTRIIDFESYLFPASVGIIGFLDNGRVWLDDEDSDKWHQGYGGGLWISPFRRAVLSITYDISEEDRLVSINAGFNF